MILCLKCMLSGELISSNVMIFATQIFTRTIHILHLMRLKCLQRQSKSVEEVLYCLCHRDQHLSRRHGTMRIMPTCGESQMISGMIGSF